MKLNFFITTILCLVLPLMFFGQFRNIYLDSDPGNPIKNITFNSDSFEGYVTFQKWIGHTLDSGHTFSKKYITPGNVDYNGYYPNLTFGFNINGVHIINKDSILVYGDYGFVPSVLLSPDQGNSFKLIYHSTLLLSVSNGGIQEMVFPGKSNIGYAVESNRILKSTNRGLSWIPILNDAGTNFFALDFPTNSTGYVASENKLLKTTNGGTTWQNLTVPGGSMQSMSFINENSGWLTSGNNLFYTKDGGSSWTLQNNTEFYPVPVAAHIKFIADSIGYYSGGGEYTIYKTTDSGKIWEPLPRNNSYSYLSYSHNKLYYQNQYSLWAGGGHGFLEYNNSKDGGATLPVAHFKADLAALSIDGSVILKNHSKPGYQYKWIRNSTQFATSYDASYISNRQSIDTIRLVVIKGNRSDTTQMLIDTRVNTTRCTAAFDVVTDTGTVKLTPGYQAIGVKHYWYFGDGAIDSIHEKPAHTYKSIGDYSIKHIVYNTIDKCRDSTTIAVQIIRTQNCLVPDFYYAADSFYTNKISFTASFDSSKESNIKPLVTWQFGDGETKADMEVIHFYDSAKYYNVCMTVKNYWTGCISSICKPVLVEMSNTCNADFLIRTYADAQGFILPARTILLDGVPHALKTGKRHTWIINDRDTINTGNTEYLRTSFFKTRIERNFDESSICSADSIAEICIDSLDKQITHIVYDSLSGCSNTVSKTMVVPRRKNVFIKAVPNPSFPYIVTFYAYLVNGKDTLQYNSRWRVIEPGSTYFTGAYRTGSHYMKYTFPFAGRFNIAVADNECGNAREREVYYIHYDVPPMACPVYPPDFSYIVPDSNDLKTIQFWDPGDINQTLRNKAVWYFGDGDSSTQISPTHTYSSPGTYTITLKYVNKNGCSKETKKIIPVAIPCSLTAGFTLVRDSAKASRIRFNNTTTAAMTDSVSFVWQFGTGDSSTEKDPIYVYSKAGTYQVKLKSTNGICESWSDTSIVITAEDICSLKAGFSTTITQNGDVHFTIDSSSLSSLMDVIWDFGDGTISHDLSPVHHYAEKGVYQVCLRIIRDSICSRSSCDTIDIRSADPPCTITAGFSFSRDSILPSRIRFINTTTSSSDSLFYMWYFGNGDSSSQKNPVYTYTSPGTYQVRLKSSTANGICQNWSDTTIQITPNPVCDLNAAFTATVERNNVDFKISSTPIGSSYEVNWNFGDGTTSNNISPSHSYERSGSYTACLTVSDSVCSRSSCDSVVINSSNYRAASVFPNPVTSSFIVQYVSNQTEPIIIEILTESGMILKSDHHQALSGINKFSYNMDNLKRGYYFVRITSASGIRSFVQFVKM